MKQTKKITLSAMVVALSTVFMVLGAVVDMLDLSVCALASLLVAFVYIEIGSPYTWLVWICTSLATFVCFPGSIIWMEYFLIFGIYPILKAYIEKLPRRIWLIVKLLFINAIIWVLIFCVELILGIPFFAVDKLWLKAAIYVLMNVAFIAYDLFITVLVRVYFEKFRPRFKNFLK